ncbi:hypothetical protein KEM54_006132 [Ascosphaera aggregata]|nr:hypothetical protein KEM54_006132 [Ascosphaera aggregata]
MSTPSRKRKRAGGDGYSRTGQRTRKITSFFGGSGSNSNISKNNGGGDDSAQESPIQSPMGHDGYETPKAELFDADEELARKLQAEWDQEVTASLPPPDGATQTEATEYALIEQSPLPESAVLATIPSPIKKPVALSLSTASNVEDTISASLPLDQSPLTFDPSLYLGQLRQCWDLEGRGRAFYSLLTRAFVLINDTQSRIMIVDTLVNMLRILIEGDPASLVPAVWLTTNSISPSYIDLELGIGGSSISKALRQAYGLTHGSLRTLYNQHGDAGDVAFEAKKRQAFTLRKPKPLTIEGVYDSLVRIAKCKGTGSQEMKQSIMEALLRDTRGAEESRYVVRTLAQHLRIGAVKATMLIALARAFLYSKPAGAQFATHSRTELTKLKKDELMNFYLRAEEVVKASYARHPNYADLVPALLEIGPNPALLVRCGLTLHIPLSPMLGSITRDLPEMLEKLRGRDFSCEYKYDGQRAQVHCDSSGKVTIFSRHLEVMTDKYPDLLSIIPQIRGENVSSFILEGEVVAVNQTTGDLLPFQTLANRAKKNVDLGSIKVNVCLFAFDLMYLNGSPLLDRSFRERRDLLRTLFIPITNRFAWVRSLDATSAQSEDIASFFRKATSAKCEGIMVKVLDTYTAEIPEDMGDRVFMVEPLKQQETDSPQTPKSSQKKPRRKILLSTYEPDKRLESWLKVKKDYSASSDTLDLVPIAAWHGQGRKAQWWSPILLAVRNPDTGTLEAVTKCMSGFTDRFYLSLKEKYSEGSENVIARSYYVDYNGPEPDVWFNPQEVWEIAFADITLSPTYKAAIGLVDDERGLSLRFPRFLKVREDKGIDEASSSEFLATLYKKQSSGVQHQPKR